MLNRIYMAVILLAVSTFGAKASSLNLGAAIGYNVFVFNDFTETNSSSQGKMAVGGNFAPINGGSFTVATNHSADGVGVYDLVVGGNFTQSSNSVGGGSIFVGGNMTWNNPTLPHNAYVVGSFLNNANGGSANGTIYYGGNYLSGVALSNQQMTVGSITSPIDFQGAQNVLNALSSSLADTAANGTIIHKYSSYALNGTDAQSNVFNLTDTTYSGATITITAPAGSTVIVNVPGDADSFNSGSIVLNGVTADHVIFNFYAAKSLSVGSMAFNGTILAPQADFTGGWGQINGQLIAKSAAGTATFNEVLFNGNLDWSNDVTETTPGGPNGFPGGGSNAIVATPEPASWALAGLGLAIFGFARMKRARVS